MNTFEKLSAFHLPTVEFDQVPLADALATLRHRFHEADGDVTQPTCEWGMAVGCLLPDACTRSLRVNLYLERYSALEILLTVAESVGCLLHVNASGCFVVPPAFATHLPTVSRDEGGEPCLAACLAPAYIPGLAPFDGSVARDTGDDPLATIERSFEAVLPPFTLEAVEVEAVVEFLWQMAPGLPVVAHNPAGTALPTVTLAFEEGATLGTVLAALGEQTGLAVDYSRTGVVLRQPGPCDEKA